MIRTLVFFFSRVDIVDDAVKTPLFWLFWKEKGGRGGGSVNDAVILTAFFFFHNGTKYITSVWYEKRGLSSADLRSRECTRNEGHRHLTSSSPVPYLCPCCVDDTEQVLHGGKTGSTRQPVDDRTIPCFLTICSCIFVALLSYVHHVVSQFFLGGSNHVHIYARFGGPRDYLFCFFVLLESLENLLLCACVGGSNRGHSPSER